MTKKEVPNLAVDHICHSLSFFKTPFKNFHPVGGEVFRAGTRGGTRGGTTGAVDGDEIREALATNEDRDELSTLKRQCWVDV